MSEQEYKDLIARIESIEDELDRAYQSIKTLNDTINTMLDMIDKLK